MKRVFILFSLAFLLNSCVVDNYSTNKHSNSYLESIVNQYIQKTTTDIIIEINEATQEGNLSVGVPFKYVSRFDEDGLSYLTITPERNGVYTVKSEPNKAASFSMRLRKESTTNQLSGWIIDQYSLNTGNDSKFSLDIRLDEDPTNKIIYKWRQFPLNYTLVCEEGAFIVDVYGDNALLESYFVRIINGAYEYIFNKIMMTD